MGRPTADPTLPPPNAILPRGTFSLFRGVWISLGFAPSKELSNMVMSYNMREGEFLTRAMKMREFMQEKRGTRLSAGLLPFRFAKI